MPTSPHSTLIQHLRRVALLPDAAGPSDAHLLTCFVERRDEAAFEALVRRHGPMVWCVCRRLLPHHHDVEDAFQATFLVLSCKAATVAPRERIANWLHGVAYRTALKARAAITRRRAREKQVFALPEPAVVLSEDHGPDVRPVLDQELGRLPTKYRAAILLCAVQGKSIREAAQDLGWPPGTVAGRLARARALLAKRLARRGLLPSAGALAAALAGEAAPASVPGSLVASTVRAASGFAAGQAAAVEILSAKVAALAEGVVKTMMMMTKLKIAAGLLLAMVMVGMGAGILRVRTFGAEPPEGKTDWRTQTGLGEDAAAGRAGPDRTASRPAEPTQYVVEARAVAAPVASDPFQSERELLRLPRVTVYEGQTGKLALGGKNQFIELPPDADGVKARKSYAMNVTVTGRNPGQVFLDLHLLEHDADKGESARRFIEHVKIGKVMKLVMEKDSNGKARQWWEVVVHHPGPAPHARSVEVAPPVAVGDPRLKRVPPPAIAPVPPKMYTIDWRVAQVRPGRADRLLARPSMVVVEGEQALIQIDRGTPVLDGESISEGLKLAANVHRLEDGKLCVKLLIELSGPVEVGKDELRARGTTLQVVKEVQAGEKVSLDVEDRPGRKTRMRVEFTVKNVASATPGAPVKPNPDPFEKTAPYSHPLPGPAQRHLESETPSGSQPRRGGGR